MINYLTTNVSIKCPVALASHNKSLNSTVTVTSIQVVLRTLQLVLLKNCCATHYCKKKSVSSILTFRIWCSDVRVSCSIQKCDSKGVYKWSGWTLYGFGFWHSDGVWKLRSHTDSYVPSSAATIFIVANSSGVALHSGLDAVKLVSKNEKTKTS